MKGVSPYVDETSENVGLGPPTTEVIKNFCRQPEIAAGPGPAVLALYGRQSGRENSAIYLGDAEHEFYDFRGLGVLNDKNRVETQKPRKS